MVRAVSALLAVAIAGFAGPALAQQGILYEVRGGVLAHDVDLWAARGVEDGTTFNGELVFTPSYDLLGGKIRPAIGASLTTQDGTSYGYADAKWEWAGPIFFFGLGLGGAVHDGSQNGSRNEKALGSRVLFHIPAEVGWQFTDRNRVSLYFEHVSNGYTRDKNEGLDNIGLRLSHRF
jgi:lipid A 3-O-deacylase